MIPDIGITVAAYVITRCVEILGSKASVVVKGLAVLTILVTGLCAWDLLSHGLAWVPRTMQ